MTPNDIRFEIKLKAIKPINGYKEGDIVLLINSIFNRTNGIAFFPIDKEFEIIYQRQLVYSKKDMDIFEGDKVLVKGTKSVGDYETEVIKTKQGFTLNVNKTLFNDDSCFVAIKDVIGNIYEQ